MVSAVQQTRIKLPTGRVFEALWKTFAHPKEAGLNWIAKYPMAINAVAGPALLLGLSARPFVDKQNLSNRKLGKDDLKIGYKNGLSLNNLKFYLNNEEQQLSTIKSWSKEAIIARSERMVDRLIEIFKFDNEL